MRTTLKRGYGDALEQGWNGNGRSPSLFAGAAASPMRRYRQPPAPRRGFLRTTFAVLGWFCVCLFVLAAGLGGGTYLWIHESVAATGHLSLGTRVAATYLRVPEPGEPATALVIGYDHRAGDGASPSRSDTIMLLRADPQTDTLSMLSFPRDVRVEIYCPGRPTYVDRINAAYAECGSKGTLETVRHLTGLDVNYLVTVSFVGFRQTVNTVGGVWIDVDRRYLNRNVGTAATDYTNIDLRPGYQRLNGAQALSYVRFRHTDSDLYRVVRQQAFVKAAKLQLAQFSFLHIPKLVNALVSHTEIAQAGAKGIDVGTLVKYGNFLRTLPPGHFFQPQISNLVAAGVDGAAELAANPADISAAVQQFVHPDVAAAALATGSALGRKPKLPKTIPPAKISVAPLNGGGVTGAANSAAAELQQRGYKLVIPATGNAPSSDYTSSKVYYDPANGGVRRGARELAAVVGSADVTRIPASIRPIVNNAPYVLVVGSSFHDLAPAPGQRVPVRQPPHVGDGTQLVLPLVKQVARELPFRLEYPTLIDSSSSPDTAPGEVPVRAYTPKKGVRGLRLTFRRQAGGVSEYWGIEETNWTDAPLTSGPNVALTLKRRHYRLYYAGGKLHMVVLRSNGVDYWVVNTLLDSLSTETMLAIAQGLRPLPR